MGDTVTEILSRESPLGSGHSGLLVIDMQYLCAVRGHGQDCDHSAPQDDPYYSRLEQIVVPNIHELLSACREHAIEVIYTVIESLTLDGRDRSLDHKLSNYHVPKGSPDAHVVDPLAPVGDEIVIPKTASGVFNATNIDYVLRNLGIERLAIVGVYTNQCVESAVRDAADRGYLVTLVEDGCAGSTPEAHATSIETLAGYARIASTHAILNELSSQRTEGPVRGHG